MEGKGINGSEISFCWVVVAIVMFLGLIDLCALTFLYVEGDDARSVAYALLGTDTDLYEPMHYHSMSLLLLSLLPKQEDLVRVVAIAVSALGAVTYLILVARIAWHWALHAGLPRWLVVAGLICLPVMIPEFAFMGLVFEPVLVGMSIVLVSHLIVRPAFTEGRGCAWRMIASAVLFGFGASLRWDTGFYGSVIVMDLLISGWSRGKPFWLFCKVGIWGSAALLMTVGALALSGYPPSAIVETYQWTQETVALAPPLIERLVDGVTFLTPAMLLLTAAGAVTVVAGFRQQWRVLAFLLASAPLFVVVGNPSFCAKAFVTVMPALVLLMLHGADGIYRLSGTRAAWFRRCAFVALLVALLVPWLVGVQWKRSDTARGPGFELGEVVAAPGGTSPRLTPAGGLGVPTPEGPRPLWGFAHVLFGGEWRSFIRTMNAQWNSAVDRAIEQGVPLHQDSDTAITMCRLMASGYELQTARVVIDRSDVPEYVHHRLYKHPQSGKILEAVMLSKLDQHLKNGEVSKVLAKLGFEEIVVVYVFPSRLHQLQETSAGSVSLQSPLTAIWKHPGLAK